MKSLTLLGEKLLRNNLVIAIDGPAASGKGTLSKLVAEKFNLYHLNSGNIYRALALMVDKSNINHKDFPKIISLAKSLDIESLDNLDLKRDDLAIIASKISKNLCVRNSLLEFQRKIAIKPPFGYGIVAEGRDIGTVVFPKADIKIFINADVEIRAMRRYKELKKINYNIRLESVKNQLIERDNRDYNRDYSPLKPAEDAYLLNTSELDIEEGFSAVSKIIEEHSANKCN